MTKPLLMVTLLALTLSAGCKKKVEATMDEPVAATAPTVVVPDKFSDAVAQMRENFQRVHFEFDKSGLDDGSKAALAHNAAIMQKHTAIELEVQGHADERGTTDYNLALGQRRAEAVKSYLRSTGVAEARLRTVSYGEEVPLAEGSGEVVWSQNRRAEFRILYGSSASVTGTVP